ncbi:MAG: PucR family transcriptional regulator, partial [Phycicoccus sp.]
MVEVANDAGTSAQTLPAAGTPTVPAGTTGDPAERAAQLAALVEHQAALLQREDEVHRVLVRVVLTGGSLAELCDAVAGFLGGAAVVTTTDGRVLAMAGTEAELDRARGLGCFDRTGRLMVEQEPVGARAASGAADRTRAFVRIVAGASDHGLVGAFCPDRPLTATDVHLLERAATVAALAITKEQAVAAVEGK